MGESWKVVGSGDISWVGDTNFWSTHDLVKSNTSWEAVKLPVGSSQLDLKAVDSLLSDLVNLLIADLKESFGSAVGEQFATPMAWFIGALLQACIGNDDTCPKTAPSQTPIEV